jgi:hypothetical protein
MTDYEMGKAVLDIGEAVLDIGYVNIEEDFNASVAFYKNGTQNIKKTLDNYIKLLNQAVNTLTLVKDSIDDDESTQIELVADFESLSLKGDQEIVDRFVGFGIANHKESDDEIDYDEDESDDIISSDEESSTEMKFCDKL